MAKMPELPNVHNPITVPGKVNAPLGLSRLRSHSTDKTLERSWQARLRDEARHNRVVLAFAAVFGLGYVYSMGMGVVIEKDSWKIAQEGDTKDYYENSSPLPPLNYPWGKGGVPTEDNSYTLNQLANDDGFDGVAIEISSDETSQDGTEEVTIYLGKCAIPNVTIYYTTDTTNGTPTNINYYDFPEASLDRIATTVSVEKSSELLKTRRADCLNIA